jgi:hypothetical protein
MMQHAELRTYPRLEEEDSVAVTVLSAPDARDMEHSTFTCLSNDLSVSGLNISVHSGIPVGAVLRLRVELTEPLETFEHVGRVVWCAHAEHDLVMSYRIGIAIIETLDHRGYDWSSAVFRNLRPAQP